MLVLSVVRCSDSLRRSGRERALCGFCSVGCSRRRTLIASDVSSLGPITEKRRVQSHCWSPCSPLSMPSVLLGLPSVV